MVPKVIIFDFGKVLAEFDYTVAAHKIATQCVNGLDGVRKLLDHSPLLYRYESGLMTRDEFFGEIRQSIGYTGRIEEFCADFADILRAV